MGGIRTIHLYEVVKNIVLLFCGDASTSRTIKCQLVVRLGCEVSAINFHIFCMCWIIIPAVGWTTKKNVGVHFKGVDSVLFEGIINN